MLLTDEQKEMLQGKKGEAAKLAMELLLTYSETVGAEELVPIVSAHIAGSYPVIEDEGIEWLEEIVARGARTRIFCTKNPELFPLEGDTDLWEQLPELVELKGKQDRICALMNRLGVIPFYSCHHYILGNLPRFGQHIAWASSGSQVFANSLLGARSNRDADHAVIAGAITGYVPKWGLHLDENRRGEVVVDVSGVICDTKDSADYKALGWYIGKVVQGRVPVIVGLQGGLDIECIKGLLYTMTVTGSMGLAHLVGITPEARAAEEALQGRSFEDVVVLHRDVLQSAYEEISNAASEEVDAVIFGCPHCTIQEILEIGETLHGRKISANCELWISTSKWVKTLCQRMGFLEELKALGVKVVSDVETATGLTLWLKKRGVRTVAMNSARGCFYARNVIGVGTWFGSTRQCVEAAISGRWRFV